MSQAFPNFINSRCVKFPPVLLIQDQSSIYHLCKFTKKPGIYKIYKLQAVTMKGKPRPWDFRITPSSLFKTHLLIQRDMKRVLKQSMVRKGIWLHPSHFPHLLFKKKMLPRVFPTVHVYAYEPNPLSYKKLHIRISVNFCLEQMAQIRSKNVQFGLFGMKFGSQLLNETVSSFDFS